MSSKRLDSLADYSRHRYRRRADCLRCKRVTVLDPLPLIERCQAKCWHEDRRAKGTPLAG